MKKFIWILVMLVIAASLFAQSPQAFKYQAVARNSSGNLIQNQLVAFRISILQGGPSGTLVYQERHTPTTNNYGLVNLEIGKGTVLSGSFNTIDWALSQMYLKVELDPIGGTAYLNMGTSEMLSVPYALFSGQSGNSLGWSLTGNSGTSAGTNFIGTTDNVPLTFRINNEVSGKIDHLSSNTSLGYKTLSSVTSGSGNSAVGNQALLSNTGGDGNTALGKNALTSTSTGSYNTAVGLNALFSNTTGNSNTAVGQLSLLVNSTGSQNTAIGSAALYSNTTGYSNSALGDGSLRYNTTGYNNTASGASSLFHNTTGYYNTANGYQTLFSNISGEDNTAIGSLALYNNTYGAFNTATGVLALGSNTSGNTNTANGCFALYSNTTGSNNTAIGNSALYSNTTGQYNTASGFWTLLSNTSGENNAAFGSNALRYNSTGYYNTAIGSASLNYNTTGSYNTASGSSVLAYNTEGYGNTASGHEALRSNTTGYTNTAEGVNALYSNTIGYNNTALGAYTGRDNTTGSGNVFIGYGSGYHETGSNKLYIANSSVDPPLIFGDFDMGNLGIGTTTPNASALLQLNSTSKGFLPPTMTTAQMNWISSPAEGLTVYNTSLKSLCVYDGTAWIEVNEGWVCGNPISYDSKGYNTVNIGSQCWMAENLNAGTRINGTSEQLNNGTVEKYCYNDSESMCDLYGGLYQWNEAMQYAINEGEKGICPEGWHIPTDGEWTVLTSYLGGESVAGGKMKSLGEITDVANYDGLWLSPNEGATNESGFSALPAGFRQNNGSYSNLAFVSYFSTSSQIDANNAWYRYLHYHQVGSIRTSGYKVYGVPVRCLKNN